MSDAHASSSGPAASRDAPGPSSLAAAARECLAARETQRKIELTRATLARWRAGRLSAPSATPSSAGDRGPAAGGGLAGGSRADVTPGLPEAVRLVDPRKVPHRRLRSERGRAAFVHAIAHIELNAVNLAWDCVHRFPDLPRAYYDDWVTVAGEEAEHFELLRGRLTELGCAYGDFDAHDGLWEMAAKTRHDLLARMAMVPRVLEARGLDVTPVLIDRLSQAGDERTAAILRIILEEEVAHVAAGTRWFRYECGRRGLDPSSTFARTVDTYLSGAMKPPFNVDARRRAGFDADELAMLERVGGAGRGDRRT